MDSYGRLDDDEEAKLERLAKVAERYTRNLRRSWEYKYLHPSHAVAHVLNAISEKHEVGYGVEGGCTQNGDLIDCQYINTGDTYAATIVYTDNTFSVNSWGELIEQAERAATETEKEG